VGRRVRAVKTPVPITTPITANAIRISTRLKPASFLTLAMLTGLFSNDLLLPETLISKQPTAYGVSIAQKYPRDGRASGQ
jgi:hypothetical protein